MSKNFGNSLPYRQRPLPRSPQPDPGQKKPKWLLWIGGLFALVVLVAALIGYMILRSEMQSYPQEGYGNLSWHICAIEPRQYYWHVFITLTDKQGKVHAHQSLLLMGDQVRLSVEELNLLGIPSAYKLKSIEGFYMNPRDEQNRSYPRNTISLDDGKASLFSAATTQNWLSRLVNVSVIQSLVLNKDGKTYNLTETQNELKMAVEKDSPLLCGFTHLSP